jgi:hypothetical protein
MAVERYKVEEFLYTHLSKVKRKGSSGYVARCPICGDSKKNPHLRRLHVDFYEKYGEWIYKCYNGGCDATGNIQSLYAHLVGCTWKEANIELTDQEYDAEKWKARLEPKKEFVDEEDEHLRTKLDIDLNDEVYFLHSKPEDRIGVRYVVALQQLYLQRLIPTRYNVCVCHKGKYKNRFIIPVFEKDEMIYFQGRDMTGEQKSKYMNPDVVKEQVVLNLNEFDPEKPIVVAEGLFCGMSVEGNQGTACLGSYPNDVFMGKIFHKYPTADIIIALDNPLIDESGFECYEKFIKESPYAKRVRYFFMPNNVDKDLNDVRVSKGWKFDMLKFIEENTISHFKASIKIQQVL